MSTTFTHKNCSLVGGERIVRNEHAPAPTMAEEGEIIQELGRFVEATLLGPKYRFVQLAIPGEDASPSTTILASRDWLTSLKLLLIVQNASGSMMGIFSRSLCLEQGLSKGSMLPYVDRAVAAGYAVLILRPNANSVMDGGKRKVLIPGSESPEVHALCVWENVVARNERATHIALLGYGNGASLCKELLSRQLVKSKEDDNEVNRIRAFVTIEASEIIDEDDGADIKNFLNSIAINMECNVAPRGFRLSYRRQKLGCTSISLGLPSGATEVTNVAESIPLALEPVFKYLTVTAAASTNVIGRFVQNVAEENGHAYAAAEVKAVETGASTPLKATVMTAQEEPLTTTIFGGKPSDSSKTSPDSVAKLAGATGFLSRMFGSSISFKSAPSPDSAEGRTGGASGDEKLSAQDFDLLNIVGKGAFGKVMLVRKKHGLGEGKYYAMKILKKSFIEAKGQIENTKSEREILCEIRHPFIVRLRFAFQNDEKLYLVTDYYNGGTLFYHLRKSRAFSEDRARFYAAELLLALDHLHAQKIIYRDLKLENVLLDHLGHVALTDFGLSKQDIDKTGGASTFCGTFEYIAPELFNRQRYGKAVDWWSFGILLFEMMCGRTPFYDKNRRVMQYRIQNTEPIFPASFSKSAVDCIRGLLQMNEASRLGNGEHGAQDIKTSAFFSVIDFDRLFKKEILPPFKPDVSGSLDTKYVPKAYLEAAPRDTVSEAAPISMKRGGKADDFAAFTFAGDSTVQQRSK